jgi:hypothetical protein
MGATLKMPLARYFMYVGGVLLALLLIVNAALPTLPVPEKPVPEQAATAELPTIRIHSDRKWPERVVFDTKPTVAPVQTAKPVAQTAKTEAAKTEAPAADVSAKLRDAFAQLQPSDVKQVEQPDPKKAEVKPQPKRKVAKRRVAPPVGPPRMLVAQQPRFGWFGNNIW